MPYITKADVELPVGEFTFPTDWDDAAKDTAISRAQERIDAATRTRWGSYERTYILSGGGGKLLSFQSVTRLPIVDITSVYYREYYSSTDDFETEGTLLDASSYRISTSRRSLLRVAPHIIRGSTSDIGSTPHWVEGDDNYRVAGTFGRASVPEVIKLATIFLTREQAEPGFCTKYEQVVRERFSDGYEYTLPRAYERGKQARVYTGIGIIDELIHPFVSVMPMLHEV